MITFLFKVQHEIHDWAKTSHGDSPWRQGEVDDGDFGGDFGRVVWVGQLGGDVKLEVVVVRDNGVTQLDHCAARLFERLHTRNKHDELFDHVPEQNRLFRKIWRLFSKMGISTI